MMPAIQRAFLHALETAQKQAAKLTWPSPLYADDPARFARDIFGIRLHPDQVDILRSVVANRRTAVVTCHKFGKTMLGAVAALWWYCTVPGGRSILFAPTDDNVQLNLYHEIRGLLRRAGCCGDCRAAVEAKHPDPDFIAESEFPRPCPHSGTIDEYPHECVGDGLKAPDGRQIFGVAATNPVALQGLSGRILIIADEAPGIRDEHMTALKSSLAARQTRFLMMGNANFATGTFYNAFHRDAANYRRFQVDAFRVVEHVEKGIVPASAAFASRVWIDEVLAECQGDEDHPEFRLRVLAKFPRQDDKAMMSRTRVEDAGVRWTARYEAFRQSGRPIRDFAREMGPLVIGADVAGDGDEADDTVLVAARGLVVLEIVIEKKLDRFGIADAVWMLAEKYREPGEPVRIKVDSSGVGRDIWREIVNTRPQGAEVFGVQSGQPPPRRDHEFILIRDEMWFTVAAWIRAGGEMPPDDLLAEELFTVTQVTPYSPRHTGKRTVERKDSIKKRLKRSPDRADALCLALWEPDGAHERSWAQAKRPEGRPPPRPGRPRVTPMGHRGAATPGQVLSQYIHGRR